MNKSILPRSGVSMLLASSALFAVAVTPILHVQPAAPATAPVPAATPKLAFATPLRWKSSGVRIKPVSNETHTLVSVKDPSDRLDGEWTPVSDANTFQKPFAGINNVTFEDGVTPWTRDISHEELIRDGYDETLAIDPGNLQLLYQGRDPAMNRRYDQLPYQLGLLKLGHSKK